MHTTKSGARSGARGMVGLLMVLGASACAATKQSAGIERVDELVTRVEAVHVEAELAKKAVYESILTLRPVVTPTTGEPMGQFEAFVNALDASEEQAARLARTVAPMEQSAREVFARWERDLSAFESDSLRSRSRERMQATRARYDAVLRATKASNERFETLNHSLRDIALFLSHDFNAAAIAAITDEAVALRDEAKELGHELDRSMQAAAEYVQQATPVGVALAPIDAAPVDQPAPAQVSRSTGRTQRSGS